jgi:hypothetical protein
VLTKARAGPRRRIDLKDKDAPNFARLKTETVALGHGEALSETGGPRLAASVMNRENRAPSLAKPTTANEEPTLANALRDSDAPS